jgi:AAA15 family ATPase/GTPase
LGVNSFSINIPKKRTFTAPALADFYRTVVTMTKHLDSLKIQNFRMLEDFEVEKLGQINLIVGKNNSGKSTVLEALRIYAGNADRHLLEEIAKSHDELYFLKDEDIQPFTTGVIRPFFSFFSRNNTIGYKFLIGNKNKTLSFQYMQYLELIDEKVKIEKNNQFLGFLDDGLNEIYLIRKNKYERLEHIRNNKIPININTESAPPIPASAISTQLADLKVLSTKWDSIVFTDFEPTVIEALRIIEPTIQGIAFVQDKNKVTGERTAIVRLQGQAQPVPLKSLGDGMQRILQIALNIYQAKDGFLLIDEFENGLHYSVQEKVWGLIFEMAKRLNIQVFATTHSWDCIEAFSKVAIKREDVEGLLFRMGRSAKTSDNGKIIATIFDEAKLERMTQADMEIR